MKFDPMNMPYSSRRIPLSGRNGVVATSNALASDAGLEILKKGGNAVDAAIATAACLTVVEPTANGIGSDNFALVWMKDKLYGLNSNGPSPERITLDEVKKSHETMPVHGWTPVTVPGTPRGWAELNRKFGNLSLLECLMPAISHAENGFPVAANVAHMWKRALKKYREIFKGEEYEEWFRTFTVKGEAPEAFEIVTLPDHARTLRLIGETSAEAFYTGELADKMEEDSIKHGGYLRKCDLASFSSEWVTPLTVAYRGYEVAELPPSGQGMVALMALNTLSRFPVKNRDAEYYHRAMESMKMAFADGMHHITDPKDMGFRPSDFLTEEFAKRRAGMITDEAQIFTYEDPFQSGTVYLATADKDGNMVSMIQSNYMGFGSGIVVGGTGISLQNRGADFKLDENHRNALASKKRTYHTIIPGMLLKESKCIGVFGVMGGYMQPQGHLQVMSSLLDFNLNPQAALDCPRWQWIREKEILVENTFDEKMVEELKMKGHEINVTEDNSHFGRGQMILKMSSGAYVAGTESRTDGNISLY
ncbi:gamma-glutamyltransferase family protein [Proteiniclasticum sp. C24MP]|uniref:gamma-glutamyltransferase family protein n=1 Tax=Proteiniclasticum sp. C24MP TaxID=3374101 RepID=UPI003754D7CA